MEDKKPLVDKEYQLERFAGKGGWTFVDIPEISKDKEAHFGMVKVRGSIDNYEISDYTLMPRGNGSMFLAVRAEIRKKINKEEGDYVRVILFKDDQPYQIPDEFKLRLKEEQGILEAFGRHKTWEQRMCVKWIYSAKRPETVNERIIRTIYRLKRNKKII
jgi:hypothetical protein